MSKKTGLKLVMIFLVGLFILGGTLNAAAEKKEITVAFSSFAPSLDVQVQFAMPSYSMCRYIYDPLVYFDWDMNIKPWLAERWEKLDDLTWKFYLRKGVTFHNGEPFNAQAVKYTMERYLDPTLKSPQKKLYKFTKNVEIVDDYTVLVHTEFPMRPLLNFWAIQGVIPPKAGKSYEKFGLNPVGTGPYKFVEYRPNDRVVVAANPNYWGAKPKFEKITYRLLRESSTRVAALLAGEVDLIANVPLESIAKIEKNPNTVVKAVPSHRFHYLAFHQKKFEPFKDKRVRQAFYYGIDRESLCKYIFGGMATVAEAPIGTGVSYSHPGLPQYNYNPQKAKKLLAEAGYADGFKITIGTPNGRYLKDVDVATAIAGQLRKIGITAEVAPTDWGVFRAERGKGKKSKFDLWLGAWGNINGDSDWAVRWLNHSPTLHGHTDPAIDELIDKGRVSLDAKEAKDVYFKLQEIIWTDAPVIYLYRQPSIYGANKDIADLFEPRADEFTIFKDRYGG